MLKKKGVTTLALVVAMSTAVGHSVPFVQAVERKIELINVDIPAEDIEAGMLIEEAGTKNQYALKLQMEDTYTNSITAFEVSLQLDPSKISGVSIDWDSAFNKKHCRYTYNTITGQLYIYVVDNKDLRNGKSIPIGVLRLESKETEAFESFVQMEAMKAVDLQHEKTSLNVDRTEHAITVTEVSKPPTTDTPDTQPSIIYVQEIQLNHTMATVECGDTMQFSATVLPTYASNRAITWSSSNKSVATISATGKMTAVAAGTTTITATANDGSGVKAMAVVTVTNKEVKVTKVKLSKTTLALKPDKSKKLVATVTPAKATNKEVTWSSSNKKVATVTKTGKVVAKSVGTTTITATASDGSKKKATCVVHVANIKVNKKKVTLNKGKTFSILATIYGESQNVTYETSNKKIATVSKKGKITAKKAGTATITVRANGVKKTINVTVR